MGTSIMCAKARATSGFEGESLRLAEAEHRHGNALQMLSNLVRRSLREAEGEEARDLLTSVSELVDTFIHLHKLCQESDPDLAVLLQGMARHWQRLCNGHIRISVEAEPGLDLPQSSQTSLLLIAQELVLNAIKHAFPGDRCGTIQIRFRSDRHRSVILEVQDDGVGTKADCPSHSSAVPHGQALVRDLSVAIGGTLRAGEASQGHGRRVTLCLPLARRTG